MRKLEGLGLALALALAVGPVAMASPPADRGDTPGLGWGRGGSGGNAVVGAPGPVAGIGLPILAVAGGLIWIKSRKRRPDRFKG
ncbi:MAG: hypothetical protein KME20_27310 [Kaiparowitsia implicata GSE-PSE-MK54-09C]|jgi:hypothetical protein|nr:hypothetical protein [Kaiparowitsia implicata GSE-PSE-MK54-09C]